MNKQLVTELIKCAEDNGILSTIHTLFKMPVKVNLIFTDNNLKLGIEDLELSVRSYNCLKRARIVTIGDLIATAGTEDLMRIRNLGRKSYIEIKTTLLAFSYEKMSDKNKILFWEKFIADNVMSKTST